MNHCFNKGNISIVQHLPHNQTGSREYFRTYIWFVIIFSSQKLYNYTLTSRDKTVHRGFNPITTLGPKTRTLFFLFLFLVFENIVIICFVLSQSGKAVIFRGKPGKIRRKNLLRNQGQQDHALHYINLYIYKFLQTIYIS